MENELNEYIKKSKESLDKVEKNVESLRESMGHEMSEFWGKLKGEFSQINKTLSGASEKLQSDAKLQGKLGVMKAREHLEKIKGSSEEFIKKVTDNTAQELDIARLYAHLAKMEAADQWREKESQMTSLYHESKEEFEKLAKKAGKEINEILLKLSDIR
jgi:predicted  nucleic acid-binding Zn-ribbon protein